MDGMYLLDFFFLLIAIYVKIIFTFNELYGNMNISFYDLDLQILHLFFQLIFKSLESLDKELRTLIFYTIDCWFHLFGR